MNLIEYPDRDLMFMALADRIASDIGAAIRQQGRATLTVPGGATPGPVFDTLSGVALDWARVTVIPNDERWVPESSERSNARLIRSRLLRGEAAAAQLVPLYAPVDTPETAMDALVAAVEPWLPLDVALLGMGADMHTASLFPGADRLKAALAPEAPVLMAMRAEAAGEPRVTLTARVLSAAMRIHVLIAGADKRAALERAQGLPAEEAPVRAILANATVHWAA
ncbi:MAG: 6-phosphogluconolactonase [Pseudomonadota bacterium]